MQQARTDLDNIQQEIDEFVLELRILKEMSKQKEAEFRKFEEASSSKMKEIRL